MTRSCLRRISKIELIFGDSCSGNADQAVAFSSEEDWTIGIARIGFEKEYLYVSRRPDAGEEPLSPKQRVQHGIGLLRQWIETAGLQSAEEDDKYLNHVLEDVISRLF